TSESACTLSVQTKQVIACESRVTAAPDPFGGSYYVEHLTAQLDTGAREYIAKIDAMGGMIPAIENGFPQSEIARASYEYQKKVESGEAVVVGVNRFQSAENEASRPPEILR